ncbi:hypothetical protein HYN48_10490 [Flavobacterium magnum]|uniref:Uncharacterized protein n=1 Tax=Flavobacterium magnum TaxID=2162713 RepID=A0A2S0RGQ3_9FLAO|nr:hypothetical protein [Flavobacterium magnum]AWA30480.1 hypothetical protein HYN48_10490 [Flavobacterium magnum]
MKRAWYITLALVVVTAVSGYLFITDANDHNECETKKMVTIDKHGNQVITEKHICREKYNF